MNKVGRLFAWLHNPCKAKKNWDITGNSHLETVGGKLPVSTIGFCSRPVECVDCLSRIEFQRQLRICEAIQKFEILKSQTFYAQNCESPRCPNVYVFKCSKVPNVITNTTIEFAISEFHEFQISKFSNVTISICHVCFNKKSVITHFYISTFPMFHMSHISTLTRFHRSKFQKFQNHYFQTSISNL